MQTNPTNEPTGGETPLYEYLLSLGSNLGNRQEYLDMAIGALAEFGTVARESTRLETLPIGPGSRNYINSCITFGSALSPAELLQKIHQIESGLGRKRTVRWGDRTCDIDIVLVRKHRGGSIQIKTPELTIPHRELSKRAFVLKPAQEIAADWVIPGTPREQTIGQMAVPS